MLKWTSESEYFLSFENFFADTIIIPYNPVQEQSLYPFRCACAARGKNTHEGPLPWRTYFSLAQLGGGGGGGGATGSLTLASESVAIVHVLDCQCSCMYALSCRLLYL